MVAVVEGALVALLLAFSGALGPFYCDFSGVLFDPFVSVIVFLTAECLKSFLYVINALNLLFIVSIAIISETINFLKSAYESI